MMAASTKKVTKPVVIPTDLNIGKFNTPSTSKLATDSGKKTANPGRGKNLGSGRKAYGKLMKSPLKNPGKKTP